MSPSDFTNSTVEQDFSPRSPLDSEHVKRAYRRQASFYDIGFGIVSSHARRSAVEAVNRLPAGRVLEVGVGTGLALPLYTRDKRVVGIDLSQEMLRLARERRAHERLRHVEALREMDAENTDFAANSFDAAVAMFVASVVPNPQRLLAEMQRVVRPGGTLLFVNHFSRDRGVIGRVERVMSRSSQLLGWHPDFKIEALLSPEQLEAAVVKKLAPAGLFTLVQLPNKKD